MERLNVKGGNPCSARSIARILFFVISAGTLHGQPQMVDAHGAKVHFRCLKSKKLSSSELT